MTGGDWTPLNDGNEIAFSGDEDFNVDLDSPTFSFGFNFVDPNLLCIASIGCLIPPAQFTIFVGPESELFSIPIASVDVIAGSLGFFGIVSDTSFTSVEIREALNANDTNEFFGEFYADAPVPIPASLWLFGSALGLLGWKKRKAKVQ